MANIKQQKKRILVAERQRLENLRYRSAIKTYFKRLQKAVDGGDAAEVETEHLTLVKLIDRAAAKKTVHANTAARRKSLAARIIAAGPRVQESHKKARSTKAAAKSKA